MLNSHFLHSLVAALSMGLALPAIGNEVSVTKSTQVVQKRTTRSNRRMNAWGTPTSQHARKRGPGWSHAHVQRMKVKRGNKTRNRKAHR